MKAIDLFSGCGGLTLGLQRAGFDVVAAIELDPHAAKTFRLNHPKVTLFETDIRKISVEEIKTLLKGEELHLLAGCPPCQGFSSLRRRNKKRSVRDERNALINEYVRLVRELRPVSIMMENVPGLTNYHLFKKAVKELEVLGYSPKYDTLNVEKYGIPQRRKRLVMVGSRVGDLNIDIKVRKKKTVRETIANMEAIDQTKDHLHKIVMSHSEKIQKMIKLIPKDGGSRSNLPEEYILECHKKENVGFNDIYGRLKWDDVSSTITSGCLNPSKGRFLHPEENRVISAREAALLQTFPKKYKFPHDITKRDLSLMIGNALPPKFSYIQAVNIKKHLKEHLV